jgi:hypothetical protein
MTETIGNATTDPWANVAAVLKGPTSALPTASNDSWTNVAEALKKPNQMVEPTVGTTVAAPFVGFNRGVASTVGFPVDATTYLLNKALPEKYQIKEPFGGSESIMSGMGLIGADPRLHEPRGFIERGLQSAGEAASSTLLPAAGVSAAEASGLSALYPKTSGYAKAVLGDVGTTGDVVKNLAAGASSGAAGQAAAEIAPEDYRAPARIVGGMAGALPVMAATGILDARSAAAASERAERLAGQAQREAFSNAATVPEALRKDVDVLPDVDLTSAQKLQLTGTGSQAQQAAALQRKIDATANVPSSEEKAARIEQQNLSSETTGAGAGKLQSMLGEHPLVKNDVDVASSYGFKVGTNPSGEAAKNVNDLVTNLQDAKEAAVKDAWQNPSLQAAGLYKKKTLQPLYDFLGGLEPVSQKAFPNDIQGFLDAAAESQGSQIPFQTLQNLRSLTLAKARSAYNSPTPIKSGDLYEFADRIANQLNDPANVRFGNTYGEIEAWNNARALTKDYHDTFDAGFMKQLTAEQAPGMPKVAPEATLDKLYGSANAAQNLRQLKSVVGDTADQSMSDYMIGRLTGNGADINVTPKKALAFVNDPKNASIIEQIPGLQDRITDIVQKLGESAQQTQTRQFSQNFNTIFGQNNPKSLANFLETHADKFGELFPSTQDQQFLTQLKNSAKAVSQLPSGSAVSTKTYNDLANNNMMTLLYGRAAGAISDAVAGNLAGHVIGAATGMPPELAEAAGTALGLTSPQGGMVKNLLHKGTDWIFGGTRDQAITLLQQAAANPNLMARLMEKPTPQGLGSLAEFLTKQGRGAYVSAATPQRDEQSETVNAMPNRSGNFARGGSVIDKKADALVNETMRNRKLNSDHTEHMLSMPDDAIVQALNIAKQVAA